MRTTTVLGALWLIGCSSDKDTGTDSDSGTPVVLDPAIDLGTGDIEFVPLEDGDTIDIVFGPQGAYHFNVSIRVQGIDNGDPDFVDDPDNPLTTFHGSTADGQSLDLTENASVYKQGIDRVPGEPGVYQMIARRLFLNIDDDDELDGEEVVVTVEVVDKDGVTLNAEHTLTAVPWPFNEEGR